jgi:hypothetical protein
MPVPPPITAMPPAARAAVRGVLTDIDDTLTKDGAIEPAALAALHALRAAGFHVLAITGRPAGWSEPFAKAWPLDAIVAENGGVALSPAACAGPMPKPTSRYASTRPGAWPQRPRASSSRCRTPCCRPTTPAA